MSLGAFCQLTPYLQLLLALSKGTHLAERWSRHSLISLYHVANAGCGFFVEVGVNEKQGRIVVLHSFRTTGPLENCAQRVRLPEA